jgi:hypothetical protein
MSRKTFIFSLAGGLGLLLLAAALTIGWCFSAGALHVHLSGGEHRPVHLVIPGALVQAGLCCLPRAALADVDASCEQAGLAWRPLVQAACGAIAASPEGEFVRVESDAERVIVAKTRRYLLVRVESAAETLRLEIPLRSLRGFGQWLASS